MNQKEKIEASEEKIQETICKSKNAFFMAEQERMLSYHDFLWIQLRVIQKRWWVLQFIILVALWIALNSIHDEMYIKRSMGVVAALFVILIIPELWKNRSCECMEIEAVSYYSLKQVYAARMLLFGVTDIFFITLFLGAVSVGLYYELSELVVQFLFPLCVTACICFGILCSKRSFSETVAIVLCVIWSALWLFIVLNENIYVMVTVPIWLMLFGLELDGLTKEFGDFIAVNHINLTMTNGVYGLLGVNGAGKTTLMRMLCTLLKPTSGTICCNGKDIFSMDSEYRKLLGYLPQDFGFYPEFTVEDYLLYIAALKGIRPIVAKKRVKELIAKVGLSKAAHKKMKKLSGGMKRRAGIAQAMLNNPKILILDEPTAGLDPNERIRFRNLISELSEDRLVLLSTHIVSDIEYIANEIWLMKDGKILHKGSIDELINSMSEAVWECLVPKNMVPNFMEKYKISNMKSETNQVMLRIISHEKPVENAMRVEASLEDVFLYYFGEKAGDENAAL